MVFSELIIKYPYKIVWQILKMFRRQKAVHFFVAEELDYLVFRNVRRNMTETKLVAKNWTIKKILKSRYSEDSILYPAFPDVIITARHALHYFPEKNIKKIGMRHGPYHFKDFISPRAYNRFDLFLLTSETEVAQAKEIGINSAVCGGYPKSDSLFEKKFDKNLKTKYVDNDKPVLLFSSTWNESGLAGVSFWYDKLEQLTEDYNIFVTLHPWVSKEYVAKIRSTSGVTFIESNDLTDYLLISDMLISDTSSIIAEYFLLDKPVITFEIEQRGRLSQEIIDMLSEATFRVKGFDELTKTIKIALETHNIHSAKRKEYVERMFAGNLGRHGQLAAGVIEDFLAKKGFGKQEFL